MKYESSLIMDASREHALVALDRSFQERGFRSTPPGLRHLLARFSCKMGESADQARRRCYRRLFGILWFGNKIGAGQFRGKTFPTYVYPECIKDVVRAIIQENLRDYQDPENAAVYHVTLEDLHRAKWPAMR
ncbi:uncharacterized protein [Montipora foliosa]|uniref:uncharacterized protein n=1 Tax=Montipora foliosa TaxID=591990 RepID=UPI0035F1F2EB